MGILTSLLAYHETSKSKYAFQFNHSYPKVCNFPYFSFLNSDFTIWQSDETWSTWFTRRAMANSPFTRYDNPPLLEFLYDNQENCVMFYCDTTNWYQHGLMKKVATIGFTDEGLLTHFLLLKDF